MNQWSKRIRDLQLSGMTFKEIGDEVGIAISTVGDLATGRTREPRGDAALALRDLHDRRCANQVHRLRKKSLSGVGK